MADGKSSCGTGRGPNFNFRAKLRSSSDGALGAYEKSPISDGRSLRSDRTFGAGAGFAALTFLLAASSRPEISARRSFSEPKSTIPVKVRGMPRKLYSQASPLLHHVKFSANQRERWRNLFRLQLRNGGVAAIRQCLLAEFCDFGQFTHRISIGA